MSLFERHRDKIELGAPTGCWLWSAGVNRTGYGTVRVGARNWFAHRVAYEVKHGPGSAEGLVVRHRCDTPACVNPDHLEGGSMADNNRDRDERGRQVAPRGEAHGCAKLTEADVVSIRTLYVRRSANFNTTALARRFGVSQTTISDVVNRRVWRHV